MEEMKQVMGFQYEEWYRQPGGLGSEVALGEGIQVAAYSGTNTENKQQQQLGRVHFCPPEALHSLNTQTVHEFRSQHLTPNRMVLAATGIERNRLVDLSEKYFADLPTWPITVILLPHIILALTLSILVESIDSHSLPHFHMTTSHRSL